MKDQIFYLITNNIEIVIISFMLNLNLFKVYFVQSIKLEDTLIKNKKTACWFYIRSTKLIFSLF